MSPADNNNRLSSFRRAHAVDSVSGSSESKIQEISEPTYVGHCRHARLGEGGIRIYRKLQAKLGMIGESSV